MPGLVSLRLGTLVPSGPAKYRARLKGKLKLRRDGRRRPGWQGGDRGSGDSSGEEEPGLARRKWRPV